MEPQAPWSTVPSSFGLKRARQGFSDYVARHRSATTLGVRYADEVGYEFDDVDARVVRIRSAFVDTVRELGRAMSTCGQRSQERYLLAAPGRVDMALRLGGEYRAKPVVMFVPEGERDVSDWSFLAEVAAAIGPNARLAPISRKSVVHASWDGKRTVLAPAGQGSLVVLHLRDAGAARSALLTNRGAAVRGDAVVGEQCRWSNGGCPARSLRMMAVGADGSLRACLSCPPQSANAAGAVVAEFDRLAAELEERRGCRVCPVALTCAKCLFCGPVPEKDYCDIRRRLGPQGLRPGALEAGADSRSSGAAIGWDE